MKQLSDYADILIVAPFCLGYLWAADKFCMKFLGTSKRRERLFLIISFCRNRRQAFQFLFKIDILPKRFGILSLSVAVRWNL